jgi:hypothetical protein
MDNDLSKNILSTIAYYDVLDYPLTSFEIWKYLINSQDTRNSDQDMEENKTNSLTEIIKELETEEIKKHISEFRGFYFLKGRENLVTERIESNKISENKLKKARKIIFWLRFIPFVKMIAVAGRVGMKNAKSGSDIDLLIIFKHGKIFTGRFLSTALIHFSGQRRYRNKINNRICFNHFLSDKLEISIRDLYSSHNYVFVLPLYGGEVLQDFLEKNQWIKNYRPNFTFSENNLKVVEDSQISKSIRKLLEKIFASAWIEKKLKDWQIKKIIENPLTQKTGGVIIYNDCELAFWPDFENQGPKVFEKFKENLTKFS